MGESIFDSLFVELAAAIKQDGELVAQFFWFLYR
jgi:hypothetical protein